MEWQDRGLILAVRKHGESAAIVSLLTESQGRHLGLVRGGQSRRRQGLLQPGNLVAATWRARLAEHLGTFTLEAGRDYAAAVLDDPRRLATLSAMTALLEGTLAERDPQPAIFAATERFVERLTAASEPTPGGAPPGWLGDYVRWELALLRSLGFGLDLSSCAATGTREGLVYVSPRSGRAVSAAAGAPYSDRLLPLPPFLADETGAARDLAEIADGLRLTGYFLERHHFAHDTRRPPAARERLLATLHR